MSSIYGIQPLKLSEICCQAKRYATLSKLAHSPFNSC